MMQKQLAKKLIMVAIVTLSMSVALAFGGSSERSDGFSGVVDAGTTDPGGKGPYQRVMTPKVKVRPDSICRFSVEANVDAPGKLTFGPNCWVKGKPHFHRLCRFNAEPGWRTYDFRVWMPDAKTAPALESGEAPLFVGIDRGGPIRHVEFRNARVEELPFPSSPKVPARWEKPGKNGFFNAGFELGLAPHAVVCNVDYEVGAKGADGTVDETCAKEGRRSLRIDNTGFGKTVELLTAAGGFAAPAGADGVTLSAWVKADRPTEVTMLVRDLVYDYDRSQAFWSGCPRRFKVGTEWTRVQLQMFPDEHHAQYTMWLRLTERAVLWVDALQIENGKKATDFVPAAPVEVMLGCADPVFVREDVAGSERVGDVTVRGVNYTAEPQRTVCRTDCGDVTLELPPKGTAEARLAFKADRYGAFECGGTFSCPAGNGRLLPFACAVVGAVPDLGRDAFFTGYNAATRCIGEGTYPDGWHNGFRSTGGDSIERHFRNLRLAGCRMMRNHDDGTGWWTIERRKGEYDWSALDTVVDQCRTNGIELLYVFGNGIVTIRNLDRPDTFKDWFVRKNSKIGACWMKRRECYLPDEKDWRDFYTALVRRYRGKIRYYEVINEPNGTMPNPDDYLRYLKLSYEIVRANDPEAKVVGICSTGDYGADTGAFIRKIGEAGGFRYFDVLSFHPYAAPLDVSTNDAEAQLREIRALVDRFRPGMPILQDEIYYLSADDERRIVGKPRDDAGLSNCWSDGNLVRRCAIDLAGGSLGSVSLTAGQLQRADAAHAGCVNAKTFSSQWCPNGRFVAANAFARLLGGATFVAKPSVRRSVNAFLFRDRRGREVALAWEREAGTPCEIALPDGVTACDLYGNPIGSRTFTLGTEPVYFFGEGLLKTFK